MHEAFSHAEAGQARSQHTRKRHTPRQRRRHQGSTLGYAHLRTKSHESELTKERWGAERRRQRRTTPYISAPRHPRESRLRPAGSRVNGQLLLPDLSTPRRPRALRSLTVKHGQLVAKHIDPFLREFARLNSCRLIRENGLNVHWEIHGDAIGAPLRIELQEPDHDDFSAFLLPFRKFILNDESVNLDRVTNLCLQLVSKGDFRSALVDARDRYRAACRAGTINYTVNGVQQTAEHMLDLWLHGDYFHNDESKRAEFLRIDPVGGAITRIAMFDLVIATTEQVTGLAQWIEDSRAAGAWP